MEGEGVVREEEDPVEDEGAVDAMDAVDEVDAVNAQQENKAW